MFKTKLPDVFGKTSGSFYKMNWGAIQISPLK